MKLSTQISRLILSAALALDLVPLQAGAIAAGYSLPKAADSVPESENAQLLQKISKGVAEVAQRANQAIVFVSIYKTIKGQPFGGMVDPFDFFFGPGNPFGGQPQERGPGGGRGRRQPPQQQPERREGGLGSGFIIDVENGYILTNNHVVQDADEIQLKLANEETYEGKIVGRDKNTDVAVVQIKDKSFNKKGLGQLLFADSDKVAVGDFAIALGAPYGLEASLSFGVVSAIGRGNLHISELGNFIQTDAAINPGNSGGPLLNTSGKVIGMNTAIYSRTGSYNGIGFAVPANFARRVAEQLINEGHVVRGYIGVALQPIDPELQKSLGLAKETTGSLVARVVPGGPAAKAGIEPGDVITAVGGRAVRNDSEIVNAIGLMRPGEIAELSIVRDARAQAIKVKVERWQSEDMASDEPDPSSDGGKGGSAAPFGLSVSKITPLLREQFRFESESGLVVVGVKPDSAAARAGLQPGDLILQAASKKVTDLETFNKITKGAGARVLLRIERSGQYFFVPLRTGR